jgi:hypothetical protein
MKLLTCVATIIGILLTPSIAQESREQEDRRLAGLREKDGILRGAQECAGQVVKRLADLGPGVHEVREERGRLKSLKIVGQERISTVLGEAKGLQVAQSRASLKANAVFVDWMKTHVTSIASSNNETIITMVGDSQNVGEQGKSSEATRQEIATKAEGLVRGLTLVAKDQNPDTKMMTLIFAWSPEKAALAYQAQEANTTPPLIAPSSQAPISKDITRKTTVSPDFDK